MIKKFHWDDPLGKGINRFDNKIDPLVKKPSLMDDLPIEKELDPLPIKPLLWNDYAIERRRSPQITPLGKDDIFIDRRRRLHSY